jgi:hypothetical protein
MKAWMEAFVWFATIVELAAEDKDRPGTPAIG